jgi:hypothetical protein
MVTVDQIAVDFGVPADMLGKAYTVTKKLPSSRVEITPVDGGAPVRITVIALMPMN